MKHHLQGEKFTPTEETLRRIFAREWRHSWPASFEDAMQNPIVSRLLDLYARHSPAINRQTIVKKFMFAPDMQFKTRGKYSRSEGFIDQKSKAAGERDD